MMQSLDQLHESSLDSIRVLDDHTFQRRFVKEIERARINQNPLCFAFAKLAADESFTQLAPTTRNELLRRAAQDMGIHLRRGDFISYRGGQLFQLLFPGTSGHKARNILTRIHDTIKSKTFSTDQCEITFKVVCGLSEGNGDNLTGSSLQQHAMRALERAEHENTDLILIAIAPSEDKTVRRVTPQLDDLDVETQPENKPILRFIDGASELGAPVKGSKVERHRDTTEEKHPEKPSLKDLLLEPLRRHDSPQSLRNLQEWIITSSEMLDSEESSGMQHSGNDAGNG